MRFAEVPLRRVVRMVNGGTPTSEAENWGGDIAWATPVDVGQNHGGELHATARTITEEGLRSGSGMVPAGSVLVSSRAPIGYVAQVAVPMAFNQGCKGLIPLDLVTSRFLSYALQHIGPAMAAAGTGTTFQEVSGGALASLTIPLPDIAEQRSISDFLDRETAQIDAMVDAQERLVALLEERRRTFLTHAVLAATSAGARVDSGLTWLGAIPATWELKPLKYLIDYMDQGWSPQCESYPVEGPDEWGVLKAGCVNGGVFRPQENKKLPEDLEPRPITTLRSGDIVVSRANTRDLVGSAAVIERDHSRLMLSDKLYRIRLTGGAKPQYVAMVLGTGPYREQIELAAGGTSHSMQNISRSDIVNLPIPVPPVDVQDRIVREVADVEVRTRSMISSAQESIALMKERRAAVISAAVTGRIDVRTGIEQIERDLEEARA